MTTFWTWLKGAWKAAVAAGTPIAAGIFADVAGIIEDQAPTLVLAVVNGLIVYLTPNKPS